MTQSSPAIITVEVAYATPERQAIVRVDIAKGTTLIEAIRASDIGYLFPHLDIENTPTGIWGKPKAHNTVMENGQRIELYRPLIIDPKESRRKRARRAD